jgi:hypothetical protein
VLPSHDCNWKLYSRVAARCAEKNYKLTLRSKDNQPYDMIKKILKSKVNATEVKVGITSLKWENDG